MSVDSFVFLRDDRLPSIEQWQHGLDELGIDISLDQIDDLRAHEGYLPATFKGEDSGFEWYYGPADETFGEQPPRAGDRLHAVDFVTGGDMEELICATYCLGVLAKLADGLFYDEDSDTFMTGEEAIAMARDLESQSE